MNYIALDFETANYSAAAACSLGMAKFDQEGNIIDQWYSLIRPADTYFDPRCTAVHELKEEDCLEAPTFPKLWPDIQKFIGSDLIVAHNAAFDMRVLKSCFEYYNMEIPSLFYTCTLQLSKKCWPDLASHSLSAISEILEIDYQAHYALDDAINCGLLMAIATQGHLENPEMLKAFLKDKHVSLKNINAI